jgi:dienelactone hydrolase
MYKKQDKSNIDTFVKLAKRADVSPYIDTSRIGVLGHSAGGGHSYYDLKKLSEQGWGKNGKLLMVFDPWFAIGMKEEDLKTLPKDTNLVIQKFAQNKDEDPRISLTTYYLLDSIPDEQKDYQVYKDAGHSYVQDYSRFEKKTKKDISEIQDVLEPLDALMAYTFEKQESAKEVALEVGSDDPIADNLEEIKAKETYQYGCKNNYVGNLIDYCKILP